MSLVDCCMTFLVAVLVCRCCIVVLFVATVDIIRLLFLLLVIVMVVAVVVAYVVSFVVVALVATY
jgi:hypothetical protein